MKSKKFYYNLDVCVNFNNIAKKKQKSVADTAIPVRNKSSFCITPLAAAVCLIISGMAFSSQVWADTTFSSPKTVSGEETLSSGLNSSSSPGATVTITSTGILNFPNSDTLLSGSEDSNSQWCLQFIKLHLWWSWSNLWISPASRGYVYNGLLRSSCK